MIPHHEDSTIFGRNNLGLASAWARAKSDSSYRRRIMTMMVELRYAWQRLWNGYDDREVFDLGFRFAERMPALLKQYKKYSDVRFKDPDTGRDLSGGETNNVIDSLIYYFERCSETDVYKRIYGVALEDDECCKSRCRAAYEESQRCRAEALRLFSKWCFQLWF